MPGRVGQRSRSFWHDAIARSTVRQADCRHRGGDRLGGSPGVVPGIHLAALVPTEVSWLSATASSTATSRSPMRGRYPRTPPVSADVEEREGVRATRRRDQVTQSRGCCGRQAARSAPPGPTCARLQGQDPASAQRRDQPKRQANVCAVGGLRPLRHDKVPPQPGETPGRLSSLRHQPLVGPFGAVPFTGRPHPPASAKLRRVAATVGPGGVPHA